ncbi:MAG: hypothetical protein ACP5NZ_00615 [Nanobdellota archaeon]
MIEYNNSGSEENVVDYFLEILEDCRELHPGDAEDKLGKLEFLFKNEGVHKNLLDKLDEAKKILSELGPYHNHCKEYLDCFNKLKLTLSEVQEGVLENYRKRA